MQDRTIYLFYKQSNECEKFGIIIKFEIYKSIDAVGFCYRFREMVTWVIERSTWK